MSNHDQTAADVADVTEKPDDGYIGRHAKPGLPDQGRDEDATYDAKHDDVDGPPGAVRR